MNINNVHDSPWSDQRSIQGHTGAGSAGPNSVVDEVDDERSGRKFKRSAAQITKREVVVDATDPLLGDFRDENHLTSGILADRDSGRLDVQDTQPHSPLSHSPAPSKPEQSPRTNDTTESASVPRADRDAQAYTTENGTESVSTKRAQEAGTLPTFNVTVGDPHRIGDLTGSHIVYQVRTKTNSKKFKKVEFEVARRYNDFLWLYNQLHDNNPGIIIPPPPEKQAIGRYESDFVESRRGALERMLVRTVSHPALLQDLDLQIFLESETFSVDVKGRERREHDASSDSKGMFSSLNLSVGSGGSKFIEHDNWFLERRLHIDSLETTLHNLLRATDGTITQRKNLSESSADFGAALDTLSKTDFSPKVTGPLGSLAELHLRIRDLYSRQAQQDVLTLAAMIEEYIRLLGSIRKAFEQRQKAWHNFRAAESDLQKRQSALNKLHRQGRTQQDRIATLQADVSDAEKRLHRARLTFDNLGKSMRIDLEKFETEKVDDFRSGIETFLESTIEAQKELIELWETYLAYLDIGQSEIDYSDEYRNGREMARE